MRRTMLIVASSAACLAAGSAWAKSSVYMSLMGEPYWTNSAGEAPFDQWLKMADQDDDGAVSNVEFRGDADAFWPCEPERSRGGSCVPGGNSMMGSVAPSRRRAGCGHYS